MIFGIPYDTDLLFLSAIGSVTAGIAGLLHLRRRHELPVIVATMDRLGMPLEGSDERPMAISFSQPDSPSIWSIRSVKVVLDFRRALSKLDFGERNKHGEIEYFRQIGKWRRTIKYNPPVSDDTILYQHPNRMIVRDYVVLRIRAVLRANPAVSRRAFVILGVESLVQLLVRSVRY